MISSQDKNRATVQNLTCFCQATFIALKRQSTSIFHTKIIKNISFVFKIDLIRKLKNVAINKLLGHPTN